MLTLYHISEDLVDNPTKLFIPRVPESAAVDEDKETNRICFSTSIANCIKATDILSYMRGTSFTVYTLTVEEDDPYLVYPQTLVEKKKVPDALENDEHWYLKEIELKGERVMIKDIKAEMSIAWTCIPKRAIINYLIDIAHIDPYFGEIAKMKLGTAYDYYITAIRYMDEHEMFSEDDDLWDYVVEQPWAQSHTIYNLELVAV